ncbi:hypothetical protein DH2020_037088 [Rehmannia glutinosa]|uniref:RRM domain-containing protein n=1 Tax=Rehmannia glutinosa TaxID=99300 RepID=A0ABR0V2K8_REHGL
MDVKNRRKDKFRGDPAGKEFVRRITENSSSFFFTNFPEYWGSADLKEVFSRYGTVKDIFIPNKRDKLGKKFGFVRFSRVKDDKETVKALEGIWIGSFKLRVNIPKYNRNNGKQSEKKLDFKIIKQDKQSLVDGRSFVEVARKKPPETKRKKEEEHYLTYTPEEEELKWLEHCMNGLKTSGYVGLKVTPIGGECVLIQLANKESLVNFLQEEEEWLGTWFEYIRPWKATDTFKDREVWLNICGVPLHGWNIKLFKLLVSSLGTFLKVDESTINRDCLTRARVLISTRSQDHICSSLKIKIGTEIFHIKIAEEVVCNCHESFHIKNMIESESSEGDSVVESEYSEFIPATEMGVQALDDVALGLNQFKILEELEEDFNDEDLDFYRNKEVVVEDEEVVPDSVKESGKFNGVDSPNGPKIQLEEPQDKKAQETFKKQYRAIVGLRPIDVEFGATETDLEKSAQVVGDFNQNTYETKESDNDPCDKNNATGHDKMPIVGSSKKMNQSVSKNESIRSSDPFNLDRLLYPRDEESTSVVQLSEKGKRCAAKGNEINTRAKTKINRSFDKLEKWEETPELKYSSVVIRDIGKRILGMEWKWRRNLFAWEEQVFQELLSLINKCTIQQDKKDTWIWRVGSGGKFSTKSIYNLLRNNATQAERMRSLIKIVWGKPTPEKVATFAWKLPQYRVRSKEFSTRRGIVTSPECTICQDSHESVEHLFFTRDFSHQVWVLCYNLWIHLRVS